MLHRQVCRGSIQDLPPSIQLRRGNASSMMSQPCPPQTVATRPKGNLGQRRPSQRYSSLENHSPVPATPIDSGRHGAKTTSIAEGSSQMCGPAEGTFSIEGPLRRSVPAPALPARSPGKIRETVA